MKDVKKGDSHCTIAKRTFSRIVRLALGGSVFAVLLSLLAFWFKYSVVTTTVIIDYPPEKEWEYASGFAIFVFVWAFLFGVAVSGIIEFVTNASGQYPIWILFVVLLFCSVVFALFRLAIF